MNLTNEEAKYLNELALDIVTNGESGVDIIEAVKIAHLRRQAFAQEMMNKQTMRAKIAYEALLASVYAECTTRETLDRALNHCENIYNAPHYG